MVWVPKAKRSVIAAAVALVVAGVSAGPGWAQQFNCGRDMPSDRDRPDSGGMSIDSARQIIASQRSYLPIGATLPTDAAMARNLLASAKNDCARAVNEKKKRIDARMCLADATMLLRRLGDPGGDLQVAHCNYVAANTLIKTQDETKALALEGVARTYEETANPVAAVPLREAIPVALRTDPRKMDLARLYARTNNAAKADTAYGDLNLLSKPDGYDYSQTEREVLREWALLRSGPLQNSQGAIEVWSRLDTAEAHSEVGRYHFNANRTDQAANEFKRVIALKSQEGAAPRVAEASYLLAIMTARGAKTSAAWNDARNHVKEAGYSDPKYKRLACLSLIAAGDKTELSSTTESDSCQIGVTGNAEDYLMRGTYLLRRAQFVDYSICDPLKGAAAKNVCITELNEKVRAYREQAGSAFSLGRDKPSESVATPARFNWLLRPESEAPPVSALMIYGDTVSRILNNPSPDRCSRVAALKTAPPEVDQARDFFITLDLLGCAPTQR